MSGMQHNENAVPLNIRTTEAIPQFANVQWAATPGGGDPKATYVSIAGAADPLLGVLLEESFAEGDGRSIRTFSSDGSMPGIASGAIAAGAEIIPAAGGKWAAGAGDYVALTAAAADGEYFSYVRKG